MNYKLGPEDRSAIYTDINNFYQDKSKPAPSQNMCESNYNVIDHNEMGGHGNYIPAAQDPNYNPNLPPEYADYMEYAYACGAADYLNAHSPSGDFRKDFPDSYNNLVQDTGINPWQAQNARMRMAQGINKNIPGSCEPRVISTKKELLISLMSALLFLLLSLPFTYSMTNMLLPTMSKDGAPTMTGLILHFVVYFLITFGLMKLLEK